MHCSDLSWASLMWHKNLFSSYAQTLLHKFENNSTKTLASSVKHKQATKHLKSTSRVVFSRDLNDFQRYIQTRDRWQFGTALIQILQRITPTRALYSQYVFRVIFRKNGRG